MVKVGAPPPWADNFWGNSCPPQTPTPALQSAQPGGPSLTPPARDGSTCSPGLSSPLSAFFLGGPRGREPAPAGSLGQPGPSQSQPRKEQGTHLWTQCLGTLGHAEQFKNAVQALGMEAQGRFRETPRGQPQGPPLGTGEVWGLRGPPETLPSVTC